jgi:ComEC/Rec2-related protein
MDAAGMQMRQNVWVEVVVLHSGDGYVLKKGAWSFQTWAARTREQLSKQLSRGIEERPQIKELVASMVFGVQGGGLETTRAWFRDAGTLHLFAVSGLNLSMLAGFLTLLLRMAGAGPRASALVAVPVLVFYAGVTGLGTSCVRALVAFLLWFGTEWVNRPAVSLNSLGAAALVLLFWDGNCLFQTSFQLSFGLVLVLNHASLPLTLWLRTWMEPDPLVPRKFWTPGQKRFVSWGGKGSEVVATTLLCWCAGWPWSVFVFHQVSPVSILANLLAVPLSFVTLALGFLALLFSPLGGVTPLLNQTNAKCVELLLRIVRWSGTLPGGHWAAASPGRVQPDLVVFDVGGGGAVLVRPEGKSWLWDCGSESQAGRMLLPALQQYGINKLDGLVLSHADSAHVGGAGAVFKTMSPDAFFKAPVKERSPQVKMLLQRLCGEGASLNYIEAQTQFPRAKFPNCEVLYPPSSLSASLADDQCVILRWSTPLWRILYTADAGLPAERWLLENARHSLAADVWIRGSHGREPTGSDDFVRAVHPRIVIVAGSHFDKNRQALGAWASKWNAEGVTVWLQEECGAVEAWSGTTNRLRSFLKGREISWTPLPMQ